MFAGDEFEFLLFAVTDRPFREYAEFESCHHTSVMYAHPTAGRSRWGIIVPRRGKGPEKDAVGLQERRLFRDDLVDQVEGGLGHGDGEREETPGMLPCSEGAQEIIVGDEGRVVERARESRGIAQVERTEPWRIRKW
jgi:hypothetical protein